MRVPLDFTLSVGLDLHARDPDETTHCRFRNALVKGGVYDDLLAEVCRQLEGHGLKLRAAEAALIDATLIDSASRPRTHLVASPQDRAEGEADNCPDMHFSADRDARWVKKGRNSILGDKGFARSDQEGVIEKVHVTPANAGETPEFATTIDGPEHGACWPTRLAPAGPIATSSSVGKHRDGNMLWRTVASL